MTAGGHSETAHGIDAPNVERIGWHIGPDRVLRCERTRRGGPFPPLPGDAEPLAADAVARHARVVDGDGLVWRADGERFGPRWVESASFFEEASMEGQNSPALVAAGFSRKSESMQGVRIVGWGITLDRRLLLLDVESGARSTINPPIPGTERVLSADPFERRVILADGEVLKCSARGWFRESMLGEPESPR